MLDTFEEYRNCGRTIPTVNSVKPNAPLQISLVLAPYIFVIFSSPQLVYQQAARVPDLLHPCDNRTTVPPRRSAPVWSLDAPALLHLQVARRWQLALRRGIAN